MKKDKLKRIIGASLVCFMFSMLPCMAQQDPLFTHYITNKMLLNPAFSGLREQSVANALYRTQWVNDIDGAPTTVTVSFGTPLPIRNVGVGIYYIEDQIGPSLEREIATNYAYHLPLGDNILSFGLEFGVKFLEFRMEGILGDTSDPAFANLQDKAWKPNFNVGVQYRTENFFLGFSTKDLLNQDYLSMSDGESRFEGYSTKIHYYFMGGVYLILNSDWVLRPSTLVKYVPNSDVDVDVTVMAYFKERLAFGLAARTENSLSALVQYEILDDLILGYSYDYYYNDLRLANGGSHEIQLEYAFDLFRRNKKRSLPQRVKTPRYF